MYSQCDHNAAFPCQVRNLIRGPSTADEMFWGLDGPFYFSVNGIIKSFGHISARFTLEAREKMRETCMRKNERADNPRVSILAKHPPQALE
jgi:hypothetical protein